MLDSINQEQGLYVLSSGSGYSCLGFDVAIEWAAGISEWLKTQGQECESPDINLRGTHEGYAQYLRILQAGREYCDQTGKRCPATLTPQLIGLEGQRVEVVDKHGEKRRFWVGKSTGWLPIHLEVHNTRSLGGGGVTGVPFQSVRVVRRAK